MTELDFLNHVDNASYLLGMGTGVFLVAIVNLITSAYESRKKDKELPK